MQKLAQDFLAQKKIAVVGVTHDPKGWGRTLYDEFKKRGYDTYAVNPNAQGIEGIQCYTSLSKLPVKVDGALLAVPPQRVPGTAVFLTATPDTAPSRAPWTSWSTTGPCGASPGPSTSAAGGPDRFDQAPGNAGRIYGERGRAG